MGTYTMKINDGRKVINYNLLASKNTYDDESLTWWEYEVYVSKKRHGYLARKVWRDIRYIGKPDKIVKADIFSSLDEVEKFFTNKCLAAPIISRIKEYERELTNN